MSRQDDELQVFVGSKCFCNDTFVWNKQPCYLEQSPTKVTAVVLNWFAIVDALIPFVERAISSLDLKNPRRESHFNQHVTLSFVFIYHSSLAFSVV